MKRCFRILALIIIFNCQFSIVNWISAQEETAAPSGDVAAYRALVSKGDMKQATEAGVKVVKRYYSANLYKEAFDFLRGVDQNIEAQGGSAQVKAALHYQTYKERMNMYKRMHRGASVKEQLNSMERYANASGDEEVKNDLLYNMAIYHYTYGSAEKGNAAFKEMAAKLTASGDYDKVDKVYQQLLASARRSNSAGMVAQSYNSYMVWKDSVYALKRAAETKALNQKIADQQASIDEKDSSLTARWFTIVGLGVVVLALAAALVVGAVILMRFIYLTRKQKKTINTLNEDNVLKAGFISNISAQLEPTLNKLDSKKPEVKALQEFSKHVQTIAALDDPNGNVNGNEDDEDANELEGTNAQKYCEALMDEIRGKEADGVTLVVNAPAMTAKIHRAYTSHILLHLLQNAVQYTPEGGKIWLEYKKQSARKQLFQVTNLGEPIPEEKRENLFKAFAEIHDLTEGDGLGLPICKKMAEKMDGELRLDETFTKGTRFILTLTI